MLGVRGALSASPRNLDFLFTGLPRGATWGAAGIGRHQLPLADLAIARGGNVRVGLEDNIYLSKGVLAKSNAELVAKARRIVEDLGGAVASVAETRAMLGLAKKT